jgi:uncharacterized protein (DUF1501 family)
MTRRQFLRASGAAGCVFAAPYQRLARALAKKVKITDVKCMIVRGTWDWNLIKVETDSGLYGIGEAYWGWGVKDLVLNKLKGIVVGEDPLNVDRLYTKMLMQSAGAGAIGGVTVSGAFSKRPPAICWAAVSGTASASTARCKPSTARRIRPPGAPRRRKRAPRSGAGPPSNSRATACRSKPIPDSPSPATTRTPAI